MKPLALRGVRRAVVVAPHPDDETIGAFGLIRRLVRRGARVDVVLVTAGGASHAETAAWPNARLRAERIAESRRAMRRAGVPVHRVQCLHYADGTLHTLGDAGEAGLARALARRPWPNLVVLPCMADDHPDHRAVARAGARDWGRRVRRLSYRVWPQRRGARVAGVRYALKLDRVQAMKRSALACYRTQTSARVDDPAGFRLTRAHIVRMGGPLEVFGDRP